MNEKKTGLVTFWPILAIFSFSNVIATSINYFADFLCISKKSSYIIKLLDKIGQDFSGMQ